MSKQDVFTIYGFERYVPIQLHVETINGKDYVVELMCLNCNYCSPAQFVVCVNNLPVLAETGILRHALNQYNDIAYQLELYASYHADYLSLDDKKRQYYHVLDERFNSLNFLPF